MPRTLEQLTAIARGSYILQDSQETPGIILITTRSEVEITANEDNQLTEEGYKVRVVSLPSTDIFDAQDEDYRESVLPSDMSARVAAETGIADYGYQYTGLKGQIVGMTTFDASPR